LQVTVEYFQQLFEAES